MNLWYPHRGPNHANLSKSSQTNQWSCVDSQEKFRAHMEKPSTRLRLQELGWTEHNISYSYNYQGFRAPEFDDRPCGLALGCSHTEGIGIPLEQTWPWLLSQQSSTHVWNLGVAGSSMDTASRLLEFYYPVLRPKFVALLAPSNLRFELGRPNGVFFVFNLYREDNCHKDYIKEYFLNSQNCEINWKKNLASMQWFCHQNQVPLVYIDVNTEFPPGGTARDLSHNGLEDMQTVADKFHNQLKEYL